MSVENRESGNWQNIWQSLTLHEQLVCWNSGILPLGAVEKALEKCGIENSVLDELTQKGLVIRGSLRQFAEERKNGNGSSSYHHTITNNDQARYKIADKEFAKFISSQPHPLNQKEA